MSDRLYVALIGGLVGAATTAIIIAIIALVEVF